jgi:CheY-like chemotaxis protein
MHKLPILVVDDTPAVRTLYADTLTQAGYKVEAAADAREALAGLASRRVQPRLIVLDLHMPGVGGLDLLRWLHSRPWLEGIPVVVVTGQGEAVRAEAHEAGCTAFLTKPVALANLVKTVQQCLASSAAREF